MNLKSLSDASLVSQTKSYVKREREMTLQVLHHLREIEARRLFAAEGFSSLFDYTTKELGYDSASAMRLLREIPEIEERIQEGALNLTNVARAIWKRDQGQCAWIHPQTGRRCTSKYRLQRDHRIPWAKGGKTTPENLRLLCFHHNQLEAVREFGTRPFLKSRIS